MTKPFAHDTTWHMCMKTGVSEDGLDYSTVYSSTAVPITTALEAQKLARKEHVRMWLHRKLTATERFFSWNTTFDDSLFAAWVLKVQSLLGEEGEARSNQESKA